MVGAFFVDGLSTTVEPLYPQLVNLQVISVLLCDTLTATNMLIGVGCEVVLAVATTTQEALTSICVHEKLTSKPELMHLLANSKDLVLAYLRTVIDAVEPVHCADTTLQAEF